MKKATLIAPYTLEITEAPIPTITDDQVLLQVLQIGVCGSDIQMYHGLHKYMTYPVVIGHEAAAKIVSVGKNVTGFSVGDQVTVEPQVFCGECYPCRTGNFNVCEHLKVLGVHMDGFACGYFAIEPAYLHLCNALSVDQATLMEPVAVGIGSAKRAGSLEGKNVAVVGAGTIGNLVAQAAGALGAAHVMITDVQQRKLDFAASCGVEYCVNTADTTLKDVIADVFGWQRADVIIDCAATKGSLLSILAAARPASQIVVTGNFKVPVEIELPLLQRQSIALLGHMMYVREDFQDAIRFVETGKLHIDGLATQHYPLEALDEAFRFIDAQPAEVMKVMVTL